MTENNLKYNIVYAGAVALGFEQAQVKSGFVLQMNIPKNKVDKLFNGKSVILKKAISHKKSVLWQQKLLNIGAEVAIIPYIDESLFQQKSEVNYPTISTENKKNQSVNDSNDGHGIKGDKVSNSKNNQVGSSQFEYDEELEKKIQTAKLMIAHQQLHQQLKQKDKTNFSQKMITLLTITTILVGGLYFYAESMI